MLIIHNINKRFADKTVAKNINLIAEKGQITALLGASGSGKSTLLNIIAGLLPPDSGSISLNGRVLDAVPPERRNIAMMFQDFALLPHLNVWQNVAFGLKMRGMNTATAREQAVFWLEKVGLTNMDERRVATLSGGEQQRTALARALAISPDVLLLLDEPFSGLDTSRRVQLQILVKQLVAQQNIPAIMVTHDPAEASLMAQQIALLMAGELVQIGTPEQLLQRPISAAAARLMGCLNVRDEVYVPPQSLVFHHVDGVWCDVVQIFRQPNRHRLDVQHPQLGLLTAYVGDAVLHGLADKVRVWIAPDDVVWFHP